MSHHKRLSGFVALLCIPLICLVDSFPRLHGDLCDWRSPVETCDESRGLACSYKTQRCTCWDIRTIYSSEKNRCVGKSGEECHYFGGERLCTENAYCLEDESLSPISICLCLKGFFKGSNGSCIKRSKHGEFCDHSSKYPVSSSDSNSGVLGISSHSSNSNCEPESGLQCVNYKCQCEPNQIYDPKRELCISLAGMQCSQSLDNCVQNAECLEKIWVFDHVSGETKMVGHRCLCKPGLKVTKDGFCGVEYGGNCSTSSECYFGEGLTCINGKCQCHPLSQVYDRQLRRCLNLAGTKCQAHPQLQDRPSTTTNQQEISERARMDFIIKPQKTSSSFDYASKPVSVNTSPFTSTAATTTTAFTDTTSTPFLLKSRNVTSRNFKFHEYHKNNSIDVLYSTHRQPQRAFKHSVLPRHSRHYNGKDHHDDHFPAEHRSSPISSSLQISEPQQCVTHAVCVSSSPSSSESYCTCKNGTSETVMGTCLLDHGESCGHQRNGIECNVFEGLVCLSDTGTCQCADPMLIYNPETRACQSTVGNPCGRMKLNPKLLKSSFEDDKGNNLKSHDSSFTPTPFYQYHSEQFMYINCEANATCVDKSVNGQFKQVCVPRGKFSPTSNKFDFAS